MESKVEPRRESRRPQNALFLPFIVKNESWNKYRLSDGSVVKSKFILINVIAEKDYKEKIKIAQKDPNENAGVIIQSQNVVGVEAPNGLIGAADTQLYTTQELINFVIEEDMDFDVIDESWNTYDIDGSAFVIKVRNIPIRISRTSKYDAQGLPIYISSFVADLKFSLIKLPK